ncbi:LacI family DNA-binding transcriptional regulator [Oscillospiraceae bacterium MB08-C2-2]|nr:LacI family DNA-binding transcriptional regulator [Oscillospiraceae bacterium MB08-C2-2]
MALTIYDIAQKAGVSITTVSRVLNKKGEVSEKTKQHIQNILDEYGYSPSQLARGLASKTTKTIGIMSVDIRDNHHANIVYEVERAMSQYGYSAIVCNLGGKKKRFGDYLEMLVTRQVDGIVFVGSIFADPDCRKQIEDKGIDFPCAIVNALLPHPNFACVLTSEEAAYVEAVNYLVRERGRKKLVLIFDEDTVSEKRKRQGYREGMRRNGLENEITEYSISSELDGVSAATKELMRMAPRTDALIYTKDLLAVTGMYALLEMGYEVPKDVSVMGINNSIYAQLSRPSLTSIDNRAKESGAAAANLLKRLLDGETLLDPCVIPCQLVIREST